MELHLHLTVAFRGLDRKWGEPIDLTSPEDLSTCLPAVVDLPTATFSSEEYLRTRRRPKPYSRNEGRSRKENVKVNDSFRDISSARIPSVSDLEELTNLSVKSSKEESIFSVDLHRCIDEYLKDYQNKYDAGSTNSLDSGLGSLKKSVFREFKDKVKLYINKKCSHLSKST